MLPSVDALMKGETNQWRRAMATEKSDKSQDLKRNTGLGSPRPPAKDDAGEPHERGGAGAPGRKPADEDQPINISTADDVDIDKNSPERPNE